MDGLDGLTPAARRFSQPGTYPTAWQDRPIATLTYALQPGVRPRGASPAGTLTITARPFAPGDDGKPFACVGSLQDALTAARHLAARATSVPQAVFGSAAVLEGTDGSYWVTVLTGSHGGQVASPMLDGYRFGEFVKSMDIKPGNPAVRALVGGLGYFPLSADGTVGAYTPFGA